ncbi:GntR family transcriptional regulator [Caballeronia arvi]|uniref:GntR family transcriptional regulator n=2 Tax=Caballeronia arvi TaxID=1777135 RepID=A0A158KW09_9BURK|nr:GntR family transcriptional regulator [Caballeronia arvi]
MTFDDMAEKSDSPVPVVLTRLDQEAAAPLWEVVKRQLSEAILMGRWAPGSSLPSEVSLAQQLGVAVGTVRRALGELTKEGLISRRRKTGTVVTGRSPHHNLRNFYQYFRLHRRDGALQRSEPRVVGLGRSVATKVIRERLQLDEGEEVVTLERIRSVDGKPVIHDTYVVPASRVPDFPMSAAEVPQLLYVFLLERYGIRLSAVREELRASLATERDCEYLRLTPPAAVLEIEEVAYDQSNVPVIYGTRRASTENHMYVNEVR